MNRGKYAYVVLWVKNALRITVWHNVLSWTCVHDSLVPVTEAFKCLTATSHLRIKCTHAHYIYTHYNHTHYTHTHYTHTHYIHTHYTDTHYTHTHYILIAVLLPAAGIEPTSRYQRTILRRKPYTTRLPKYLSNLISTSIAEWYKPVVVRMSFGTVTWIRFPPLVKGLQSECSVCECNVFKTWRDEREVAIQMVVNLYN